MSYPPYHQGRGYYEDYSHRSAQNTSFPSTQNMPNSGLTSEHDVLVLRPSKILALDDWMMAIILSVIWVYFGAATPKIIFLLAPWVFRFVPDSAIYTFWLFPALLPLFWAVWSNLKLHYTVYQITNQRIIRRTGVLNAVYDEVELSRLRDFRIVASFYLRMFGLGNLHLWATDRNTRFMVIRGQPKVSQLRDLVRQLALERQNQLGYREVEVGGG